MRFHNDGGKAYARCEAHLVYEVPATRATRVTFAWNDDKGAQMQMLSHVFGAASKHREPPTWDITTGDQVRTRWVEFAPE